jgi:hypothetical protein
LDYAVFDAVRAGFKRVVFVIREEFAELFKAQVAAKYAGHIAVDYVFQSLGALPEGFAVPAGREKPWGTGHALWCAREALPGPFAVVNADDFYGAQTFRVSVSDGGMSSPSGTNGALVTINLAPVNDAPFAVAQSVTTLEDTAVVINLLGVDADGNIPTVTLVANGTNGFYNVNTSTYSPNANFFGVDTLTFRVSDGVLNSTVESVNIVVNAVNDAPVLGAVAVAGTEDTLVSFNTALFTTQYSDLENNPFTSLTVATLPDRVIEATGVEAAPSLAPNDAYILHQLVGGMDTATSWRLLRNFFGQVAPHVPLNPL